MIDELTNPNPNLNAIGQSLRRSLERTLAEDQGLHRAFATLRFELEAAQPVKAAGAGLTNGLPT